MSLVVVTGYCPAARPGRRGFKPYHRREFHPLAFMAKELCRLTDIVNRPWYLWTSPPVIGLSLCLGLLATGSKRWGLCSLHEFVMAAAICVLPLASARDSPLWLIIIGSSLGLAVPFFYGHDISCGLSPRYNLRTGKFSIFRLLCDVITVLSKPSSGAADQYARQWNIGGATAPLLRRGGMLFYAAPSPHTVRANYLLFAKWSLHEGCFPHHQETCNSQLLTSQTRSSACQERRPLLSLAISVL